MILTSASILAVATARAGSESLKITDAWVPAVEKAGGDVPLVMTIHNESSPDALMRVRCAAAMQSFGSLVYEAFDLGCSRDAGG